MHIFCFLVISCEVGTHILQGCFADGRRTSLEYTGAVSNRLHISLYDHLRDEWGRGKVTVASNHLQRPKASRHKVSRSSPTSLRPKLEGSRQYWISDLQEQANVQVDRRLYYLKHFTAKWHANTPKSIVLSHLLPTVICWPASRRYWLWHVWKLLSFAYPINQPPTIQCLGMIGINAHDSFWWHFILGWLRCLSSYCCFLVSNCSVVSNST